MRRLVEIWRALREMDWDAFIEQEVKNESVIDHWVEVGEGVKSMKYE